MPQLKGPLVTLSIEHGTASSASPFIRTAGCEQIGASGVHSYFAILEPLSPHPENFDLAPLILQRLEQELATRQKVTATAAISSSVEAVNEELHLYNKGRDDDDKLFFGLTCGITREEDLYIAQVLPSQILISQDGVLHAFPELESWHWSRRSESSTALEQPLGLHGEIEPDLYHTRIEPGDLIVMCSGSLASVIQREPQDVFAGSDAHAAIEHLRELTNAYNIDNASSIAIPVTAPSFASRRRHDLSFLRRVGAAAASFLPEDTARRVRERNASAAGSVDTSATTVHTDIQGKTAIDEAQDSPDTIHADNVSVRVREAHSDHRESTQHSASNDVLREESEYWEPRAEQSEADMGTGSQTVYEGREGKRTLTEIVAGAVLALVAAVIGVWQLAVNRDRTSLDGPREDESTFGLPRLQRYGNSIQGPDFTGVRRRLPRAPINKYAGFVSVGLIVALAVGLFYSISTSRDRERTEEFNALIEQATVARASALDASDPATAQSFLQASEARIGEAAAMGVDEETILSHQAALEEARDASFGIERLGNIQVLGGIPSAPDGVNPNLFFGNGQLYIFTDALYLYDPEQTRLLRLISEGDGVGGETVGQLLGAAWGHGNPMVMDGHNVYTYNSTSKVWTRHALGTFGEAYSNVAAISGYIGNLYILSPESGQIIRYHGDQFDALPEDWTGGSATSELAGGIDMMIDGRIYVLTEDGTFLDFYRGALDNSAEINATPEIDGAVGFSFQTGRSYFYVADQHDRILRVTTEGEVVQQFMSEADAPQIRNVRQLAVDDAIGTAYVLTDDALMQIRLPGPPR